MEVRVNAWEKSRVEKAPKGHPTLDEHIRHMMVGEFAKILDKVLIPVKRQEGEITIAEARFYLMSEHQIEELVASVRSGEFKFRGE